MHVPDLTPPYPRETLEDRGFVLRATAWACALGAPVLVLLGVLSPSRWTLLLGVSAAFGSASAFATLRKAPYGVRWALRAATIAAFAAAYVLGGDR